MKPLLMLFAVGLSSQFQIFGSGSIEHRERLTESTLVLREVTMSTERAIPPDLMDRAACIVIIPGLKKGAFLFGARYGKGYVSCRKKHSKGWTAPGTVRIEGRSIGLQIGGSATDVVILIMNQHGMDQLLSGVFKIGGGSAAAVGPIDRTIRPQPASFNAAEVISWSRTRGIFAGVSMQGATISQDLDENFFLYGQQINNRQIVDRETKVPAIARELISALNRCSSSEWP